MVIDVRLTNADKVLYPATGTTKSEVFRYYTTVAAVMLPHIAGRPATRKRWPNGVEAAAFFEKELAKSAPAWLDRATLVHKSGATVYPVIDTGWPGSPSRRRWKSMCRNGVSPPTADRVRPPGWCSTSTPARASR